MKMLLGREFPISRSARSEFSVQDVAIFGSAN